MLDDFIAELHVIPCVGSGGGLFSPHSALEGCARLECIEVHSSHRYLPVAPFLLLCLVSVD